MSQTRRIRLLLVDDNPAVLRQITQVLPGDFEILETFESGERLESAVASLTPDAIVLDISLPGENGIVLASRLTRAGCSSRIVFLTVHRDADYVGSALAAGASGYVVKMRLSLDLEPALRAAVEGERFISPLPELRVD